MRSLLLLATLAGISGCGMRVDSSKEVPAPDRSAEAISLVENFYGIHSDPTVVWYGGAAVLTCTDPAKPWCGDGGRCWLSDNGAGCTAGETQDNVSLVADWGLSLHEGPLAHELAHVRWGDSHASPCFAPGGEVDQANVMLEGLGM